MNTPPISDPFKYHSHPPYAGNNPPAAPSANTFYPQPPSAQQGWNVDAQSMPSSVNVFDNGVQTMPTAQSAGNDPFQMVAAAKTAFDIFASNPNNRAKMETYFSWFSWPVKALKPYFQVSHAYVLAKIALIFFPFTKKVVSTSFFRIGCARHLMRHLSLVFLEASPSSKSPRAGYLHHSLESLLPFLGMTLIARICIFLVFDLVIHTIVHAFVTYVIIASIISGIDGRLLNGFKTRFTPDVLGLTASSALVTSLLELFVVRAGFFFLGLGSTVPILEYVAYVGYKYIGLVAIVLGGLLSPTSISSIITRGLWVYFSIAYAVFALRSMKDVLNLTTTSFGTASLLPGGASSTLDLPGTGPGSMQRRRIYFLLLVAALQAVFSYYLIIEPKLVTPIGKS